MPHIRGNTYISLDFIVGKIRLDVRIIVTRACLLKRVNLWWFRLCSGSDVIRGLPRLRVILGFFLCAEAEAPAASWTRFVGVCL